MPKPVRSLQAQPDPEGSRFLVEPRIFISEEPFRFESGDEIPRLKQVYETYGTLDADRSNAILVFHGVTGDAHAGGIFSEQDKRAGWWRGMIGAGRALDPRRYFIICPNFLAGSGGTSGPSSKDPRTGKPYGLDFPVFTVGDMVRAQKLLTDSLGIERFHTIIGPSTGGIQALQWASLYPACAERVISVAGTSRASAHTIAFDHAMREAIRSDPAWKEGRYHGGDFPAEGVSNAVLIGLLPWLTDSVLELRGGRALAERNEQPRYTLEVDFEVERFFTSRAKSIAKRIDANNLLYVTKAIDYFDLSRGRACLAEAFAESDARFQIVAYSSDWRYPAEESQELADALRQAGKPCEHHLVETVFGHSSFLIEWDLLTPLVDDFLSN